MMNVARKYSRIPFNRPTARQRTTIPLPSYIPVIAYFPGPDADGDEYTRT